MSEVSDMYYLGIDGGGTKTKAILTDHLGNIIGEGLSGPSSIRTVDNNTSKSNILESIEKAIGELEITITCVFAGLGDIESDEDKSIVKTIIKESEYITDSTKIQVESDVFNALYGGLGDLEEGLSVIIGTGSVAFGIKGNTTNRVGGYSFKEGDPGSSFYLGRLCLWHVSKVLDGRRKVTPFGEELLNLLDITTRVSYVDILDDYYLDRTKTAQLAKLVTKFSEQNDQYALLILQEGIEGIVEIIDTCSNNLSLQEKNVAVIGSLGNYPVYFDKLQDKLYTLDKAYKVFKRILDPSLGAVIGAMKLDGRSISKEIIEKFKKY